MREEKFMAANTKKRTAIKYIRDGIKQKYGKGSQCEICGTDEELEFHHYHTVAFVLENYVKKEGIPLDTTEEILAMRDEFYKIHWHELVTDAVTLCRTHHTRLHAIYGQKPLLSTVEKQRNWVKKMHGKANGLVEVTDEPSSDTVIHTGSFADYIDYKSRPLLDFMV